MARTHQGKGNFEGMFVQYSERAQGDARLCAAEGRQHLEASAKASALAGANRWTSVVV